jgi:hypothetical protein
VNEPALVRVMDGVADLDHQLEPLAQAEMAAVGVVAQRRTADELHREVRLHAVAGVGRARVVDLGDAWMLQTPERLRFLCESGGAVRGWPILA